MATSANKAPDADRAIVIGIGNYPRYGPNQTARDLAGPVADANAIAKWLVKNAKAEVTLMTSNGREGEPWTVTQMRPQVGDVQDPLNGLVVESLQRVRNGAPSRIARRLYIYVAGHGFMPAKDQVALVAADSIEGGFVQGIGITAWADWFAVQYHFDELVLWMDCCAGRDNYQQVVVPLFTQSAPRPDEAKMLVAYAAKPNQDAYEGPIGPKGAIRGIFTANLLKGLNGAAKDEQGRITSQGLKAYLEGDGLIGTDASTALKPEHHVPRADPMVLARLKIATPRYTLLVPVDDGETVSLYHGNNVHVTSEIVANGRITAALTARIYKATGPKGFSKLFEIGAGSPIDVDLR